MRMFARYAAVVVAAVAILFAGQPATADGDVRAQQTCGFHELGGNAYYRHCDPVTHVRVYVDMSWLSVINDYYMCADPGLHDLGYAYTVDGAWYTGELC